MKVLESIFPKSYQKANRTLVLNELANSEFPSNRIKTSKYNIINFFPKCLFLQFMRVANFYFLATAVVQSIDIISPLAPFSAIAPLVFVLVVSLIREAIDDIKRHRNDYRTNLQKANVMNQADDHFTFQFWKDLQVGDFIKVYDKQMFPADLLLLTSSDEMGVCYVETSNLDGERNLKCKQSVEPLRKEIMSKSSVHKLQGKIVYERPNNMIHNFKGNCYLNDDQEPSFLNNHQVLLRGTTLKNTDWILGVVIYTGHDSKIMKNQGVVRHKTTHIESRLNKMAVWILILQGLICMILAILNSIFTSTHNPYYGGKYDCYYIYYESDPSNSWSPSLSGLISYFSFFLLLNTMIPISLIISMEVIKVLQSMLIEFDAGMYYEPDKMGCKVLNTMIHEELGKIEYIFADKTGTLTSNNMEFKSCTINFIDFSKEILKAMCETQQKMDQYNKKYIPDDAKKNSFTDFWLALSLCHDVLVDESCDSFQGSSPDEVTLVQVAKTLNFEFKKRNMNQISMDFFGKTMNFELLAKLDFTSERKRMSVVVRDPQTQKIILYSKGADSVILPRVAQNESPADISKAKEHLKMFSKEGLRTLCVARAEIEETTYQEWFAKYQAVLKKKNASKSPEEDKKIELEIIKIEEEIEKSMNLLGITAVEDKLQEGVPQVIQNLHEAGIKIWMLTGDKLETAENIGYLCSLINKETKVFRVKASDIPNLSSAFEKIITKIYETGKPKVVIKDHVFSFQEEERPAQFVPNLNRIQIGHSRENSFSKKASPSASYLKKQGLGAVFPERDSFKEDFKTFALVIEGDVISHIFSSLKNTQDFLKIIPECRTVICCRSTPNQKAEIVRFMKNALKKVTLAIGDGGNDVNMIQTADIGVGLYGKEGNQAATSSDYSFCQFRYLWNLLFVHGRWSYLRNSFFVNFFFYKNIFFTFQQVWFAIYSGFSSQTFWEDGYLLMFNSIVTNFAPASYALFEQDLNPHDSPNIHKAMPKLYKIFKGKDLFSYGNFLCWFIKGTLQSLIIFYVNFYCLNSSAIDSKGFVSDLWSMSILSYSSTFAVIMIELCIQTQNYTVVVHIFYWILAVVLYFPFWVFVWNEFSSTLGYYAVDMFGYGVFWLAVLLNMAICGCYQYSLYVLKRIYRPDEVAKLQMDRNEKKKKHKRIEISKRIEFNKKLSKAASQNGEREYEMDNLARESEGNENVAYEQASTKHNALEYNFINKLK